MLFVLSQTLLAIAMVLFTFAVIPELEPESSLTFGYLALGVYLLCTLIQGVSTLFGYFRGSKSGRLRRYNQYTIHATVSTILGRYRSHRTAGWPHQAKISYALVTATSGNPVDRGVLSRIHDLDFHDIIQLEDAQKALKDEDYTEAYLILEKLSQTYGLTAFIYDRLRLCYLRLSNMTALEDLYKRFGASKDDFTDVRVAQLATELSETSELTDQRSILERIHEIDPNNKEYSIKYINILRNFGEYERIFQIIKKSWDNIACIELARIILNIIHSGSSRWTLSKLLNTLNPSDNYGYSLLRIYMHLENQDVAGAESVATSVMKRSSLVSYVLQLEVGQVSQDARIIQSALTGILSANIPEWVK